MNEHIKLILMLISLLTGIVYLASLHDLRKRKREKFPGKLYLMATIYNGFLFFTIISKYWVTNILGIYDFHNYFYLWDLLYYLQSFILLAVFLMAARNVAGYKNDLRTGEILAASTFFFIVLLIIYLTSSRESFSGIILENFFFYFNIGTPVLYLVIIITIFHRGFFTPVNDSEGIKRSFALFMSLPHVYELFIIFFRFVIPLDYDLNIFAFFATMISLNRNLFPLLWIKFSFSTKNNLISSTREDWQSRVKLYNITRREEEVIRLLMEGKSNKEIEDELSLSMHTVKNHLYNIYRKLRVNSRTQVVNRFVHLKN